MYLIRYSLDIPEGTDYYKGAEATMAVLSWKKRKNASD